MVEMSDHPTGRADLPRVAVEATFGSIALAILMAFGPRLGLRVAPGVGFAACLGLAHLAQGWLAGVLLPGGARRGGGMRAVCLLLAGLLVLLPVGIWMRAANVSGVPAADAAIGLVFSVVAFGVTAALAGRVFAALPQLRGAGSLDISIPSQYRGLPEMSGGETTPSARRDPGAVVAAVIPSGPAATAFGIDMRRKAADGPGFGGEREADTMGPDWLDPDHLPADWLETSGALREGRAAAALRRAFDIAMATGLLVGTLPVLLLTALAIRLETRGPVLYRQERVGRDGRVFTLFKFRSMSVDAEANGAVWAIPCDPRVTRVGQFIRLTRIDEIPQVLNVLRGEMAFIGPRPERPVFVAQLERAIPHYGDRAVVRPGITGWAQVRYRYGASVDDARMKLGYDLYYIRHRSLMLDLRILASTVRVVLLQEGAR